MILRKRGAAVVGVKNKLARQIIVIHQPPAGRTVLKGLQWRVIAVSLDDTQPVRRVILIPQPRAVFGLSARLITRRVILESICGNVIACRVVPLKTSHSDLRSLPRVGTTRGLPNNGSIKDQCSSVNSSRSGTSKIYHSIFEITFREAIN